MADRPDRGLQARARAARALIADREIDPLLALDYVVSPTLRLAAINSEPGRIHSAETRQRALDLVDAGMSWAAAGREVGVPKPTIGMWVSARRNGHG